MKVDRIGVIGGGAWGTALAQTCARAGRSVTLWEYDAGNAAHLVEQRESKFLPGVKLHDAIAVTTDLTQVAQGQAILLVVPAQAMRATLTALSRLLSPNTPLIACAKGIERGTHKFMTEIIAECAPKALPAILSGPSFAADVARGLPTAVTVAAGDAEVAEALAHAMNSGTFRPYHSTDVRGVELGGATKNVLAIAAGIVNGRGLGASAFNVARIACAGTTNRIASLFATCARSVVTAMASCSFTPGRNLLSRCSTRCAALPASYSHKVTLRPARAQVCASAVPQAPPPMTPMRSTFICTPPC